MGAPGGRVAAPAAQAAFDDAHADLLLALLRTPTVTPMETGEPAPIAQAQQAYAAHARMLGFEVELHEAPPASALERAGVPAGVHEVAERMGDAFLASQPNLVLRLGPRRSRERTLMLNAHVDTVGGELPVGLRAGRFRGRGAVDMKGPAVALLAGVGRALRERPDLPSRTTVLVQLVAGEEGGAMGVHGTRVLLEQGYAGRLNVFAEPTGGRWFDACTASMTARVGVRGTGATDDAPHAGHNATLLLGHLATELAERLDPVAARCAGKLCVGGLHTGTTHDRVYGEGALLVNLIYPTPAAAQELESAFGDALSAGCRSFARRFAGVAVARRTAADAERICELRWLKRGLPPLANRDPELEARLAAIGLERVGDEGAAERFTCDAIWGGVAGGYTIVFGPGSVERNGAHGPHEHVDRDELESYARALARLVLDFDDRAAALGQGDG